MNRLEQTVQEKSSAIVFNENRQCNPNANENGSPKFIGNSKINEVSAGCFTRDIRHALKEAGHDMFVEKCSTKELLNRAKAIIEERTGESIGKIKPEELRNLLLSNFIDLRLFGLTPTYDGLNGMSPSYRAINVSYGQSVNEVYTNVGGEFLTNNVFQDKSNTPAAKKKAENGEEGASEDKHSGSGIGRSERVNYSLIAHHLEIIPSRAKENGMTYKDLMLADWAVAHAVSSYRSFAKSDRNVLAYLRVENDGSLYTPKDFRDYFEFDYKVNPRNVLSTSDFTLDMTKFINMMNRPENKKHLKTAYLMEDGKTVFSYTDAEGLKHEGTLEAMLQQFTHLDIKHVPYVPTEDEGYYGEM